jgi:hypothetical protein
MKLLTSNPTSILHGHDIILSKNNKHIIVADDDNLISSDSPDKTFGIDGYSPSIDLFNSTNGDWRSTLQVPISGSLVHIEVGMDSGIYGATEQYINKNENGFAQLRKQLKSKAQRYINSFDPEIFTNELPLPGPLVAIDLSNGKIEQHTDIPNQDPFDIKMNGLSGKLVNAFTSHNHIAHYESERKIWLYKDTLNFGIKEPFGLCDIPETLFMAINRFEQGIAIFNVVDMSLLRYYDVPTHGLKHMLVERT